MGINNLIKNKIKQFIENKDVCVLATCSENKPRASTVNYAANGFTLYIVTSKQSTKIKNIKLNPNVSVAIDDQGRQERACLQAEGIAEILNGIEEKQARKFYSQKRNISHDKPELVDTLLRIKLNKIMFTDYTKGRLELSKFEID
jgi:nitroimidazol reductase NimA-like FMN-containing flavoprotein (pyridoxamine 5'-phosphate oxidase superfamily)